ncbi:MAG: hypothetical protein H6703_04285 [Myxococcales bacterium]|nr:hypothetical protein [Myxococcales bacterium]
MLRGGDFFTCTDPRATLAGLPGEGGLIARCGVPPALGAPPLFIIAIGHNDLRAIAHSVAEGGAATPIEVLVEPRLVALDTALRELRAAHPGAHIVLANATDWSDGTADPSRCPRWPDLDPARRRRFAEATAALATGYMQRARAHGAELVLVYENSCGHGVFAIEGSARCPGAGARWVDPRVRLPRHPTPRRHRRALHGGHRAVIAPLRASLLAAALAQATLAPAAAAPIGDVDPPAAAAPDPAALAAPPPPRPAGKPSRCSRSPASPVSSAPRSGR